MKGSHTQQTLLLLIGQGHNYSWERRSSGRKALAQSGVGPLIL